MQYILSILPLLACPIMMGVMMWMMLRGNQGNQGQGMNTMGQGSMATMATPHDSGEIAASAPPTYRTPEEQMAELKARLTRLQVQQHAIAGQMTELDDRPEAAPTGSPPPSVTPTVAASLTANRRAAAPVGWLGTVVPMAAPSGAGDRLGE